MPAHLKIDYIEFQTTDRAATKAFFAHVFGWKYQDYGDAYTAILDAGLDGGFSDADDVSSRSTMLVIFYSDNLEETRDAVLEAGGELTEEIFSFPGGRRFHFREPGGNTFAVWSE
tara:strand:+ start:144 stop:488 length:345 start_codon:yes stop_codon:yes gene_type:complete